MKKLTYYILAGSLFLGACSKSELDLFPYNQVETKQAFNTEQDITLAVNGMYNRLKSSGSYYSGSWNIIWDCIADNLIMNQSGRLSQQKYSKWQYNSTDTHGMYQGGYTIVRTANAILENIEKFPAGAFKDNAKGEALAVRAMTYFDMSRIFSKAYVNAVDADSTINYTTTTDYNIKLPKEPLKGFYDKVIADLTQAYSLINTSNGAGRLNKAAVAGLLSRVYLYKGDWTNCITAANNALGTTPNLPSIANFPGIWTDVTEAGVLFKLKNTNTDNVNTLGVNYYQAVGNPLQMKSEYVIEYNLAQLFQPGDVRTTTYVAKDSLYQTNRYNQVVKWRGRAGQPAGVLDAKVLRTAEVLLNRAEAEYRSGATNAASDDVNLLKTNRINGWTNVSYSGQALLDEILLQRRLELAFEGDRFFDLKRRNQPIVRDGTKGDKSNGTGISYDPNTLTMPVGSKLFLMPFPQLELDFNKNLTQNPEWR